MNISLEFPAGVMPIIRGRLVGPPEDLSIEIRMVDLVTFIKLAQADGAKAAVEVPPVAGPPTSPFTSDGNQEHDPPPEKVHPLAPSLARVAAKRRKPARKATAAQQRWAAGLDPEPLAKPEHAPAGEYVPSPGSIPDLVLRALGRAPATSLELTNQIGHEKSGAIYQAVKFLRAKGVVEGFEDETDGTRRWRLCQK